MAYFKAKNHCDKRLKIKNLRWQLSCIFCRHCRGLPCFFSMRCFHMEICQSKLPIFGKFYNKCERWRFCRVNFAPKKICSRTFFSQSSWYIRDFLSGLPKVILWLLWGVPGAPRKHQERIPFWPHIATSYFETYKSYDNMQKFRPKYKNSSKINWFQNLKNDISHGLDKWKISITRSIFEIVFFSGAL